MPATPEPIDHFRRFITDVGELAGHRRGWKSELAEILGVHPSHITRVLDGTTKGLSDRLMRSICVRTGLDPAYFTDNPEGKSFMAFWDESLMNHWRASLGRARSRIFEALGREAQGAPIPPDLFLKLAQDVFLFLPPAIKSSVALLMKTGFLDHLEVPSGVDFILEVKRLLDGEGIDESSASGTEALDAQIALGKLTGLANNPRPEPPAHNNSQA